MWSIFKDENEYNEKAIIGFISFALMCVFGIVDLVMGIIGTQVEGLYLGMTLIYYLILTQHILQTQIT